MDTVIYRQGTRYNERQFKTEAEFENLVVANSKTLFGQHSVYVDAKKKIDNSAFGGVIPDGFLFNLTDPQNPEFYIVEVELADHDFFRHIFPQVTKFFAFFKNSDSQGKLIKKLYSIFEADDALRNQLKSRIGNKEIFKFLQDTIENSQNILMIIDDEKKELPEITETYTDTWGKMVKVAILKEYAGQNGKADNILALTPDFENIESIDIVSNDQEETKTTAYTEAFHLDGVTDPISKLYGKIKSKLLKQIPNLIFNPQRYYISLRKKRNFAFMKIKRKKITIVVKLEESKIRQRITNYPIETLAASVQKFYNGPCARVVITDDKNLTEVINLLTEIQK